MYRGLWQMAQPPVDHLQIAVCTYYGRLDGNKKNITGCKWTMDRIQIDIRCITYLKIEMTTKSGDWEILS